jgi:uncharacterized membrane protein YhaH (DUF805 family)
MDFVAAIKSCLTNYVAFAGRARRSEYWYFFLFTVIVSLALDLAGFDQVSMFFSLVTLLPGLAVGARRLHDTDRSGWWLLLFFVPIVGWIVLIVWFVKTGTQGANRFGDDPKNTPAQPAAHPDA